MARMAIDGSRRLFFAKKAICECDGTSEDLFSRGICLPSGSGMSDSEIDKVCEIIKANI